MKGWGGALLVLLLLGGEARARNWALDAKLHHLRATERREWADFPAVPEAARLSLTFRAEPNAGEWSLRLRQQDVRQTWKVLLNGKQLGRLIQDENDAVVYFKVPPGWLARDNRLVVEQVGRVPDDVRVGEISLDDRPLARVLGEATVEVTVREEGPGGKLAPVPCRITVVNAQGALLTTGARSGRGLAVRPGVIYTADGRASVGLPAGDCTIYAGRGFAYGLASARVSVRPGETARVSLTIRREVPTPGYASCDTHVHTLTWSGHGDSSDDERAVTIAGEGIDLPIATDHNVQIDYGTAAARQGLGDVCTPVVGNEVTTAVGHFNVFPVRPKGPVPDYRTKDWKALFRGIDEAGARVVILNHPRDLHAGFRPFGPERFLSLTGTRLDGRVLKANALEVVNSGALQTDVMKPFRDWFGLLNAGQKLTPVGGSDSHDVSRYIVGQARTYVRCKADRPGRIDVAEAVDSFRKGRVLVSCGLLCEITVDGKHGPGDLVPVKGDVKVRVLVRGPSWVSAARVELYLNGRKVREAKIIPGGKGAVKWSGEWVLPRPRHDAHLVAIATGPGVTGLYWPIARPYQAESPVVRRRVIGATGAVWLDADGDGAWTSPRAQAERLLKEAGGAWPKVVKALGAYDEAVAAQAADLLRARGVSLADEAVRRAARDAGPQVERAFQDYQAAWRECQIARERRPGGS